MLKELNYEINYITMQKNIIYDIRYVRRAGLMLTSNGIRSLVETAATELLNRGSITVEQRLAIHNVSGPSSMTAEKQYVMRMEDSREANMMMSGFAEACPSPGTKSVTSASSEPQRCFTSHASQAVTVPYTQQVPPWSAPTATSIGSFGPVRINFAEIINDAGYKYIYHFIYHTYYIIYYNSITVRSHF